MNGATAKKPTKNLTELNVNGPILSMPVSCAIKVVPQIRVQTTKQIKEVAFFISKSIPLICKQSLFQDFPLNGRRILLLQHRQ